MTARYFVLLAVPMAASLFAQAAEWSVAQDGSGDFTGTDEAPLLEAIAQAKAAGGGIIRVHSGHYQIGQSLLFSDVKRVTIRGEGDALLQLIPALATELAEPAHQGAKWLVLHSAERLQPGLQLRILAPGERLAFNGKPRPNFTAMVDSVSNDTVILHEPLAFPAPAGTRVVNDKDLNLLVFRGACEDIRIENLSLDGALRPDGLRQATHHTRCGIWVEGRYDYENGASGPKPSRITLRDCRIRNFHGRGVAIYSGEACSIERCLIENVLDEGVDLDHFTLRCRATENVIRNAPVGIELNDANDCAIEHNTIEACDTGIRIWRWCRHDDLNTRNVLADNRLRGIRNLAIEFQAGTFANTAKNNVLEQSSSASPFTEKPFSDLGSDNRMINNTLLIDR